MSTQNNNNVQTHHLDRPNYDSRIVNKLKYQSHLTCSICFDLFIDPCVLVCGHSFCKLCITVFWDSANHRKCPLCNEINFGNTTHSHTLKNMVEDILISCKNCKTKRQNESESDSIDSGDYGCEEIIRIGDEPIHLTKKCKYEEITCDIEGCGMKFIAIDMDKHDQDHMGNHLKLLKKQVERLKNKPINQQTHAHQITRNTLPPPLPSPLPIRYALLSQRDDPAPVSFSFSPTNSNGFRSFNSTDDSRPTSEAQNYISGNNNLTSGNANGSFVTLTPNPFVFGR